jgi:capsular polysaccharide export protein
MIFFTAPRFQRYAEQFRQFRNDAFETTRAALQPAQVWKRTAFVFNVAKWKRPLLRRYLSEYNLRFLALQDDVRAKERWIALSNRPLFIVWGRTTPAQLRDFAAEHEIAIHHVEDGFFRSIGLGASHALPYSLCYDRSGLYYDASAPSDLEHLLNTFDFAADPNVIQTARRCMALIREAGLSKYNEVRTELAPMLYGPKVRPRILVIGQVEDDQSLLYGCERIMTNAQLVELAVTENLDAQVIYKPHPDVMAGFRKEISEPAKLAHVAEILRVSLTMADALHEVDRVYTLTSLAGFEALLRGVPVTTVGAPFYSGWGLTDDRQPIQRRSRQLPLEAVFAAAYILYPRYMDPETRRFTDLEEEIAIFLEKLSEVPVVTPEKALERIRPYNFATQHSVDPRFLYNSTSTQVAVIADSSEALLLARGMVPRGKRVTFIATRDALANDEQMLIAPQERDWITVTSIHKRYGVSMSANERNAVQLTQTFADSLRMALNEVVSQHLSSDIIDALCFGLGDYIYYEALRFYGMRACLEEFDQVLVVLKNPAVNGDVAQCLLFHAKALGCLGKVYLSLVDDTTRTFLKSINTCASADYEGPMNLGDLRSQFSRLWWSLQDSSFNDYASHGQHVAICGNVASENYAYSPASLKLLEAVESTTALPTLFFNSGLLPASGQDEVKTITLKGDLSARCTVYNGHLARFRKKYPPEVLAMSEVFDSGIRARVLELARQRLPEEFVAIFKARVEKYVGSLFAQVIFVSEAGQAMDKAVLYATAMERNATSRILTALARARRVPSIGIQPQIVSTSPRYSAPAVDVMGVIDSAQAQTYEQLGSSAQALEIVGSVNIIERLQTLDEAAAEVATPDSRALFFAMQHSNPFEMLQTALALRDICARHGFTLVVKPHPHQELPVLNEVRSIFGQCDFARVLNRDSDTYSAVARCGTVVGLFSSVLLECAIWGKPVVIAAFRDLESSIDFSRQGLAVKALDAQTLERLLVDITSGGAVAQELAQSRDSYLARNQQFCRPYDTARLDQFIRRRLGAALNGSTHTK